ncbi:unannotated protein [freshwater metagenome]|uniref:Unannotated protein n=1 Tax=freshwater metagenome TaxID=449393 RepID=A0A6J7AK61_9ZZZZ
MQQHHRADVGGDGVRLGAVPDERGAAHKRAVTVQHVLHTFTVRIDAHEVAHGHVGTDVAYP